MNKLLLIFSISFLCFQKICAAGPAAAEVTYRHLKNMEYEVTMVAYRDCRSTPWGGIFDLYIYNDSFGLYTKPTRVKIEDILQYCKSKPCNPSNTTVGSAGIEAHYYTDTIDFNSGIFKKFVSKKYCNVYFALNTCCRNGAITTMLSGNMFVESMLNLCLAQSAPVNSPQFINSIPHYISCNLNFSYSFYSNQFISGDSVSYELVKAKSAANSYESYTGGYSEKLPMTPLCSPPGVINCTPSATTLPARGITFNPQNGNFIFTPVTCNEVGVVVCQVNVFRKDSGKFKLVGYSKRDMMLIVLNGATNKPTLTTYRDYNIKARENYCMDIKIKDDTTKTTKDTVKLIVKEFPKYGTLSLLDSNAREKTMHYCWNVSDSDYLKKKEDRIVIYAYDKPCNLAQVMSTVINFKVVAPDSLANITIRTYYDINKNGKREAGEPYRSAPVLSILNKNPGIIQTDANGFSNYKPFHGQYTYNINRSQYVYSTVKDTILQASFDSSHVIELGFNYVQGIKGKVFEDVNNNCVFDNGTDLPLRGIKVISKNANAAALTDINGDYLFNSTSGKHILAIDPNSVYLSNCNPVQNTLIVNDSQFTNFNFALRKKAVFADVAITLQTQPHIRNNAKLTQYITIENKGNTKAKKFYVKMVPSRKLFQFSSNFQTSFYKDTIYWLIDSINAFGKKTIDYSHTLMSDSFSDGDQITYHLWADFKDSVNLNNYYRLTETISNVACCKTEKIVYAPAQYYPDNNVVTFKIVFIPTGDTKRALISDQLDTNRFDLRTLKILSVNNNPTAYVNRNILYAEFSLNSLIYKAELVYSIELKSPVKDSFTVYNGSSCQFDYQALQTTNTTATKIISPIVYENIANVNNCSGDMLSLGIKTAYKPQSNNHFKVYLSDSSGNFSQATLLLDTTANQTVNLFKFRLPIVHNSNPYLIKVMGTLPETEAFVYVPVPNITINPIPEIRFNTNLNNGKICEKDTMKIISSGAAMYAIKKYGGFTGGFSADSIYSEKMKNNANYQISFKSDMGCINISPIINAYVLNLPDVALGPNYTILCHGENVSLNFSGAQSYELLRYKSTVIASGIKNSPYLLTPTLGNNLYTMLGTDLNGCKDTSNQIFVQVNPVPAKPVITRIGKALQSSFNNNNQWYNLNGRIDTAINQYFYPPEDGSYFVKHIDSNGCVGTSDLYNVNYTAIADIDNFLNFNIFPNPASQYLTIENLVDPHFRFELIDTYGRSILKDVSEKRMLTISTANLNSGQYVLKIKSGKMVMNYKISILK